MQFDIPTLPTVDQLWMAPGNVYYRWTGIAWELVDPLSTPVSRVPTCTTAPTPPLNAFPADFWYNTTNGFLFIYYDDGNTIQWVVANPGRGTISPSPDGPPSAVFIDDYPPMNPVSGALWWSNDLGVLFVYYDDGTSAQWVATGGGSGGGSTVFAGDLPPTAPLANSLWWNTTLGELFIYYSDGTSTQWVPASPSAGESSSTSQTDVFVDDFGARNDGTDAAATTTGIQAAIDYVAALGGGRVRLSGGTYLIQDSGNFDVIKVLSGVSVINSNVKYCLKLKNNVTLEGVGEGATTLKLAPAQMAVTMLKIAPDAASVNVRRMTILGNRAEGSAVFSGSTQGIRGASNNLNCTYSELTFKDFWGRVLNTNGDNDTTTGYITPLSAPAKGIVINKVRIENSATKHISVRRTDGAVVSECFLITNGIPDNNSPPDPPPPLPEIPNADNCSAYEAAGSINVIFANNDVIHVGPATAGGTQWWGVSGRVTNDANKITFTNLRGFGGREAFSIVDASHIKVAHCRVENANANGIVIQCIGQSSAVSRDLLLDGNTVINPKGYAISVGVNAPGTNLTDVMIVNNYLYDDGAAVMTHGLRNNGQPTITAYASGNIVRGATTADTTGTFLPLNQTTGTWTPALTFQTPGTLVVVHLVQEGLWWRQGNLVFYKFALQTSTFTLNTAAGDLRITGLPFACSSSVNGRGFGYGSYRGITKANFSVVSPLAVQGTTSLAMQISGSGQTTANVGVADMPSGGTVRFEMAGFYEAV